MLLPVQSFEYPLEIVVRVCLGFSYCTVQVESCAVVSMVFVFSSFGVWDSAATECDIAFHALEFETS